MYSVNANGPDGVAYFINNDLDFIFGTDFLSNLAVSNLLLSVYYSCTMHSLSISHVDMRQRNLDIEAIIGPTHCHSPHQNCIPHFGSPRDTRSQ